MIAMIAPIYYSLMHKPFRVLMDETLGYPLTFSLLRLIRLERPPAKKPSNK